MKLKNKTPYLQLTLNVAIGVFLCAGLAFLTARANAQSTNAAAGGPGQSYRAVQIEPGGPSYVDGEILIKFRADATDPQIADVVSRAGVNRARHIQTPAMRDHGDPGITRANTSRPVPQALQALQNHPAIEYAQPNWIYQHQGGVTTPSTIDDLYFQNGWLWGMYDGTHTLTVNQYGSAAIGAWLTGFTGNNQVCVGVIDEGIDNNHPDLDKNIWTNPGEIAGNGADDDGNGYKDDIHGWNAIDDNGTIYDSGYDNHGTHVAGTIGGTGANGFGVAGINWKVSIISGKFLGRDGSGTTADAIQAIDYMTKLKSLWNEDHSKGANIVALNNSWGGGSYDASLLDAIKRAAMVDILCVAAAGNGNFMGRAINLDRSPFYPACYDTTKVGLSYDSVIAITAINASGAKASWANYGKTTVDLGAPGVEIVSTLPGGSYSRYDGTSMATPHVTGAIALFASVYPTATAADIRSSLISSTTPTVSLSSITATGGRLDVPSFLSKPVGAPALPSSEPLAPTLNKATAISSSQIKVEWTDNSGNETGFRIVRSGGAEPWSTIVAAGDTSARMFLDQGLSANTKYTYEITAYNALGEVAAEGSISATTMPPPPPAGTATFVAKDTTTKGNWITKYGAEGYHVILDGFPTDEFPNPENPEYPENLTVTRSGEGIWGWAFPFSTANTDVRDLQSTIIAGARGSGCWYSAGYFTVDLNFNDSSVHRVALYCLDWENAGRKQTIDIIDPANNTVLSSQSVSSFSGGQYLIWDVSGHVIVRFTCTGGINAVVSGLFFDTPPDAPPTVSITNPADGSKVSGTVTITALASDDRGVSQVEFFADGASIKIDANGDDGWSATWNTESLQEGSLHSLTATAKDNGGNTSSATVSVTVDNVDDPPTISITSPANGSTVSGTVTITAAASDDDRVTQVEFFANDARIGTDLDGNNGWSLSWDTTSLSEVSSYSLTAKATDTGNQTSTSALITVNVQNSTPPPTEMHCGDLDGTKKKVGRNWQATVTVTIHDANHVAVPGATVNGAWSNGSSASGITGSSGTVSFSTGSMPPTTPSVTFTIVNVTLTGYTYNASANHDVDGGTDGTTITITKP